MFGKNKTVYMAGDWEDNYMTIFRYLQRLGVIAEKAEPSKHVADVFRAALAEHAAVIQAMDGKE